MKIEEIKCSVCPRREIDIEELADFISTNIDLAFESYEQDLSEEPNEKDIIKESIAIYLNVTR